ncbi:ARA1 [Linum perenne]
MATSLVFAYYITGHGFGHATRVVEVARHLINAGHVVHVVTAAPDFVFTSEIQSPNLFLRRVLLDCGAVQSDALTVDRLASLEKYSQTAVIPRETILATEVDWLKSIKADLVVSDVVPIACRAAADAGIRSVCITNFSWDFIYADYVMAAGHHHRSIILQIAEDYSHCEFLIRLPGFCPMPAFRDVIDVPLVVRRLHKSREEVRKELGVGDNVKLLIFNFGGQPAGWKLKEEFLPTGWQCLVAARILQDTALGNIHTSYTPCGARRLRDAIVMGYQLQGISVGDSYVPDWYVHSRLASLEHKQSHDKEKISICFCSGRDTPDFEILHGDLQGLSDTANFLKALGELCAIDFEKDNMDQLRERRAAARLFNWEEEIFVARAPGRLDVMGGIADYSGSLVLQMPIKEACHVAVQKNHPSKQKLWKHAQARHDSDRDKPTAIIEIVSFGADSSNRGPTFDMDISDFMDGEKPISYEAAFKYFSRDTSQRWAAYVAGAILVLMTELGVRFEDSISIVISSAVPEGKGVSSSAAVEVGSMSAIAAAHGLKISPRDIALLCQKVENHIVGAPCGVMDQMASACGETNKLLAMVCQPAEVLGVVDIPSHIKFWGIDSGLRHSVGGSDYGSVRIGTFMGRKMMKLMASDKIKENNSDEIGRISNEVLEAEAALAYLCNLSPHRQGNINAFLESAYASKLPEQVMGEDFLKRYDSHDDPVTVVNRNTSYAVKASTAHPVYENFRVKAFKSLLTAANSDEQLEALGELMYQCHYSYSACGLGSVGTDRLVEMVQMMQPSGTLYGAKITGGGSGGTVCVMGKKNVRSNEQILEIQKIYKAATGFMPYVFEGSSPGAGKFGYLKIRRRSFPGQNLASSQTTSATKNENGVHV